MEATVEQTSTQTSDEEELCRLTDREEQILQLIFEGKCSSEVACALCVSKRTVDSHLAKAYVKLGVSNRFQAFRRALELGIIGA
ncbi:MAG: helix-turn-helix transcriptional regulator [Armatimonadetes bacterium]|nr:helix-turn-helix transcriptional regulator [Armatimonadota bacterium]